MPLEAKLAFLASAAAHPGLAEAQLLYYGFLALALLVFPHLLPLASGQNLLAHQGWYWTYLSTVYVAREG